MKTLRQRRKAQGLTQAVVACRAGLTAEKVSAIETGRATNKAQIRRVRAALVKSELLDRAHRHEATRQERINRLWAAFGDSAPAAALKQQMLDRVWWLLDHCKTENADTILYFLPEPERTDILNEFFDGEG